jgi:tripartite-type tricarboxylate transporter receptor subunit TctC
MPTNPAEDPMKRWLAALACLALAVAASAHAQDKYPSKLVRLVVPFAAGGSTDVVARALGQELSERIGQPVIVENKPGAGGTVGSDYVAKSPPDGYTLLIGTVSTHGAAVSLYEKLPYEPLRDFAPITEIATIPNLVVVNAASVPVQTLAELVQLAKKQPGKLTFASNGAGTSNHLATELLKTASGIDIVHVPYKGSGPALNDLLAGHVSMMLDVVMTSYPHVKAGKLKALAVTGSTRSPLLPDVPTVAEQGFPGFEAIVWFGVLAPAKTPPAIVERLNKELVAAINSPKLKTLLESQGAQTVANTPAAFTKRIGSEIDKWRKVVQASGAKLD